MATSQPVVSTLVRATQRATIIIQPGLFPLQAIAIGRREVLHRRGWGKKEGSDKGLGRSWT